MKSRSAFGLLALAVSLLIGTGAACSSSTRDPITAKPGDDAGGEASVTEEPDASSDASLGFVDGASNANVQRGVLSGIVHAPNGTIPISGALVYISDEDLPEMKVGVHCDECVVLKEDVPYALTNPDGSFELPFFVLGEHKLIVQKGGFRRVRTITLEEGDMTAKKSATTLPTERDTTNGDDVPAMAVVAGIYDKIEDSLTSLGLSPNAVTIQNNARTFLSDANAMSQFDIIFIPCGGEPELSIDPTIHKNLRDFAEAGGRVYVTDWHYDFVHQTWPGYVTFEGATTTPCSGCGEEYDSEAQVEDQGLKDWLAAQGINSFQLQANWTKIMKLSALPTKDKDGGTVAVQPKVWVKSQPDGVGVVLPNTVSFEQGCGRVLFSTYHTETSTTLQPQARALLYILLEVSVCTESVTGIVVR